MEILRVDDLCIGFAPPGAHGRAEPRHDVVRGVGFRIPAGRTVALVGESGSGKSVIAQAIMGLLPRGGAVTGGSIRFRDPAAPDKTIAIETLPHDGARIRALRGRRIGMVFQEPMLSLSPVHRIGDQIDDVLRLQTPRLGKAERRAAAKAMLALVGFREPARAYDSYPFMLSGGMRQRAMLAMALIARPALLIADEPTTALDVTIQAQVLKLMKDLQAEIGLAILLITHDLGVVANMADEVVVIHDGQVMEAGTVEDIFLRPEHPYLMRLLLSTPRFRPGQEEANARAGAEGLGPPLLSIRGLVKAYPAGQSRWFGRAEPAPMPAVDDVGFDIRRGECLGLVGESGCGKTTLSKLLLRAIRADSGSILFDDGKSRTDLTGLGPEALRRFRPHMAMVFQDPVGSLSPRMTIADILTEPLEIHGVGAPAERVRRAAAMAARVGLDARLLARYPHSLSGGQRQRVGIARALMLEPDLLICDEAVSALDVSVQAQILNLLKDLQRDLDLTCLFISHNLAVVGFMADRIAVMAGGRIVEIGPRDALLAAPVHPYTKRLLAAVPYPDLRRRLSIAAAPVDAADPSLWPPAFRDDAGIGLASINLGFGHQVLARRDADHRELRS